MLHYVGRASSSLTRLNTPNRPVVVLLRTRRVAGYAPERPSPKQDSWTPQSEHTNLDNEEQLLSTPAVLGNLTPDLSCSRNPRRRTPLHGPVISDDDFILTDSGATPVVYPNDSSHHTFLVEPHELDESTPLVQVPAEAEFITVPNDPGYATSHTQLYQNLLHLLQNHARPFPLARLVRYHAAHPPCIRSARTYNLLLSHAMHQASFGTMHKLLEEMNVNKVASNDETSKLIIRHLVLTGRWKSARGELLRLLRDSEERSSTSLVAGTAWLELFGVPKQRALNAERRGAKEPLPTERIQQALSLPSHEGSVSSQSMARVVLVVSRALIRAGDRTSALNMTRDFLKGLPPQLTPSWQHSCTRLIELHAASIRGPDDKPLRLFYQTVKKIDELVACHPSLQPTSTTLFLLLGHLRGAPRPAYHAHTLIRAYKRRFGPEIVDDRVQRRLSGYLIKQNHDSAASENVQQFFQSREHARVWSAERALLGGPERVQRGDLESSSSKVPLKRWRHSYIFRGIGVERGKWSALTRKLARRVLTNRKES